MKNQRGFSLVNVLLLLLIVGITLGTGFYIYRQNQDTETTDGQTATTQQTTSPEIYTRTTEVPDDWKTYTNGGYGFSFSYPKDWSIRAEEVDNELTGAIYPHKSINPQGNPQYSFYTVGTSLSDAIDERKRIVNNNQSAEDGIKLTITNEQVLILDGHEAVRIDMKSDDGTSTDSYTTEFYILANNRVYVFDTSFHDEDTMKNNDVLTIFESIKIQ